MFRVNRLYLYCTNFLIKYHNSMKKKPFFHYRNAFKSDHLASADVEELQENNNGEAILTVDRVEYFEKRKVAGRTVDKGLVAFFKEKDTKPMIVNSYNSKILRKFIGTSNVNEWTNLNLRIELYVNPNVKMSGQVVGGIRIKDSKPSKKELPSISDDRFEKLLEAIGKGSYTVREAKETYSFTDKQEKRLK